MEINSTQSGQILATDTASQPKNVVKASGEASGSNRSEGEGNEKGQPTISLAEIEEAQQVIEPVNRELSFQVDKNSDKTIVSVVDRVSGDVIRQIPSEEFVKIAEKLKDMAENSELRSGILFNSEV